ncbi:uncharacterized protein LOC127860067 isoform X5 [Dreissena polymorpha]|uniref:uncharacterized protein LOC127860067 isoform X5 n=1 Tax=Dreissena polymorpha TaxID=45954 RepID=UPI002264669C|nr:uncharacterized protein LOC127860067 isoform X5 [Dreissena polymorpha]
MTDRNVFRMVVFHTPRGRLSETRGLSEGPVITELPDDFEVDNVKAVKGVKDSSNDSNDNIDTNTDIAANALANDENALDYNARAKLVENKQSGRAYTDLVDNEETGEKTDDKCTPKHEDRHTHFTLGFQFTTKDLPSKHPSNFIRSNDRFTNDPKKHDTKELEIESPTGPESDFNDSSKPLVSANRNEKRSAKLNKNAIPKKSERSFVEDNETPKKPSTKETPVARSNKNYSTRRKNEEADRLLETKHCVQSEARRDLNDFGNGGPVEDSRSV